ncbi:antiviral reverse transcriptase Drt3b [Stenotrophomonas pavanii]|uniref:antiviral reverse transcriptase Drt3b n=1 Tax=Stenotrophomonas pavanii TaxID=487698 RepID=UPI00131224EC
MSEKTRVKVRKSDKFRSLVTETSPAETPIVFSNDGLYLRAIKNSSTSTGLSESVFDKLIKQEGQDLWHIPYSYKIKKNALSHRQLSVPHPGSQWRMMDFYSKYSPLITNYTSRSTSSLRAPKSIAGSYFTRSNEEGVSRYKRSQVSIDTLDKHLSHSPSYFSYFGHGRLYKFFDSKEFIELERRHSHLWMLDVAKCFDSIYTHTISWAVKSKEFSKENIRLQSFGNAFDALMQSSNFGETSGILIGPEVSRIFAEIILQQVDVRVKSKLQNQNLVDRVDFEIRRYVDDYFIFANDPSVSRRVFAEIESELTLLKMSVNDSKVRKYERPFMTEKSKSILDSKSLLSAFVSKFTKKTKANSNGLRSTTIYKHDRLFLSFCNDVKSCCSTNECGYDEVSGYLISGLKNRAIYLMDSYPEEFNTNKGDEKELTHDTYEALALIIKCVFFLYSVAPSVTASYKISMLIVVISRFSKQHLPQYAQALSTALLGEATVAIDRSLIEPRTDGFIDLETQNILLAVSEFSDELSISPKALEKAFINPSRPASYFNLVSAIYYIKSGPTFSTLRKWVCDGVDDILSRSTSFTKDSEKALTALDFIGCPHIDIQRRLSWAKSLLSALDLPSTDPAALAELVKDFESLPWFVDWREIDLLNLLERKELRVVY